MGIGLYMLTGKVTGKLPDNRTVEVSRKYAAESMVLLKNENVLPLVENKVAVFGSGAIDTFVCGTGSGFVFSPYRINVVQGLINAGVTITSNLWIKNFKKYKKDLEKKSPKISFLSKRFSGISFICNDPIISETEINASKEADVAIYVVARNAGEGGDRKAIKGDYYLSDEEVSNIKLLVANFKKVVVVLNTCVIDANELNNIKGIGAIVLMGQSGLEAGNALADLLYGKVAFSGRLVDTWAKCYDDYPASKTFSLNDNDPLHEVYNEGIYVGYRYFDSFNKDVIYPFGYGLSYTTFIYENEDVKYEDNNVVVSLDVVNTGNVDSKEVVQVYVSAPNGKLSKPYQELKGFSKTSIIKASEKEHVTINIPLRDLASYNEESTCYELEPGDYLIRVGNNSRNTKVIAKINIDKLTQVVKLSNQLVCNEKINELVAGPYDFGNFDVKTINIKSADIKCFDEASKIKKEVTTYVVDDNYKKVGKTKFYPINLDEKLVKVDNKNTSTLLDVKEGKVTMNEFVASLDYETLLRLVTGNSCETPHPITPRTTYKKIKIPFPVNATGKLTNQYVTSLLIPPVAYCDGPAGLHMMGYPTTTFPTGMALSHTWNKDAAYEIGDCFGIEMEKYNLDVILGPGMNIHRDPLCGRNFEYYSEDPILTGNIGANFVKGVQENHKGRGVAPKHFALNNQEEERVNSNSVASERAIREIYLKGFEILVKASQPETIMSSYNLINGVHTSSRYDLLTDVLRGEWGFKGYVMTDWDGTSDRVFDLYAGNDIIMGGYQTALIAQAITGAGPDFEANGEVKDEITTAYGGFFKKHTLHWNSFVPSSDGKDEIKVHVEKDVELGKGVNEGIEKGYASVVNNTDGSKDVIYKGTKRGTYLPIGTLQANAARILSFTVRTSKMDKLIEYIKK